MNYLFLCDMPTGRLVNFGTASVQHRTVIAVIRGDEQRRYETDLTCWRPESDCDDMLLTLIHEMASDWGVFLEVNAYRDALVHFFGREDAVFRDVSISRNGVTIGTQRVALLTHDTAFKLTALSRDKHDMRTNLNRLIHLTPLRRLHWINFDHHTIQFATLFSH